MLRNKLRLYILNNQSGLKKAIQAIEDDCCAFNGDRLVTREGIPNLNAGGIKLREFIENYFFPPVPPLLSLTVVPPVKEYGDFAAVLVAWSVTKKTLGVTQITINTTELAPAYPDEQINEDTDPFNSENSGILELPVYWAEGASGYTFFMYVRDSLNNIFSQAATLNFLHRRIWLATGTDLMGLDSQALSDYLNAAIGEAVNPPYPVSSELAATRAQERFITCNNEYVCFLWPMDFGGGNNDFKVNDFDVNLWQTKDFLYVNTWYFNHPFRLFQSWNKLYGTFKIEIE